MNSSVRQFFSRLRPFLVNRYTLLVLTLGAYSTTMEEAFEGLPSVLPAWRMELPILLYLYYLLNRVTRKSLWQPWITALPVMIFYIGTDIYHFMFGRLPRFAEFSQVPELFQVTPLLLQGLIVLVLGLPLVLIPASLDKRRWRTMVLGLLPFAVLVVFMELFPDAFVAAFEKTQKDNVFYSEIHSARNNGRLSMMLYSEARRKSFLARTAQYRGNNSFRKEFEKVSAAVKAHPDKRNVHLVVMESFFDPTLLSNQQFSRSPAHPEFEKLFKSKGGLSVSPVFAGGTAQAEFEVLCGVPAMRELSGVEFDAFTGAKTLCLPNVLGQGGYRTISTNSFAPDFFNSANAYASMGFSNSYYPKEYAAGRDTYFSTGDTEGEKYMFDGTLFEQNLEFVARELKEHPGEPLFNYVIAIYGHTPYDINYAKRPKVVEVLGKLWDEGLEKAVNQYYYRTEAVAAYVKGLLRLDPESLIIVVSDHLPAFDFGEKTFKVYGYVGNDNDRNYLNRIYIVENRRTVTYNTMRHFDVPRVILNYVTRGAYCHDHTCNFISSRQVAEDTASYWDEYMAIMANAMDNGEHLDENPLEGFFEKTGKEGTAEASSALVQ